MGIGKVVWASSETVLGYPFADGAPRLLPESDDDPLIPTGAYGISKAVTEELARHMHRVYGTNFVGLRLSRIHHDQPGHPHNYEAIRRGWNDPGELRTNLFGYVDARDVAGAVLAALTGLNLPAPKRCNDLCRRHQLRNRPNGELVRQFYPGTSLKPGTGPYDSLVSNAKAKRLIGYEPQHSWRDVLDADLGGSGPAG